MDKKPLIKDLNEATVLSACERLASTSSINLGDIIQICLFSSSLWADNVVKMENEPPAKIINTDLMFNVMSKM